MYATGFGGFPWKFHPHLKTSECVWFELGKKLLGFRAYPEGDCSGSAMAAAAELAAWIQLPKEWVSRRGNRGCF